MFSLSQFPSRSTGAAPGPALSSAYAVQRECGSARIGLVTRALYLTLVVALANFNLVLSVAVTRADEPGTSAGASSVQASPNDSSLAGSLAPENFQQTSLVSVERPRVVLLKNDRCLKGIVRQLGDQVIIDIDNDARIAKPATEVLFIADDLEGIYRYKRSRYTHLGPGEHIRLARWSLAVGLHARAAEHFLAVNREASDHPKVKQLGVELREQLLKDVAFRDYLGLPAIAIAEASAADPTVQTVSAGGEASVAPIVPAVLNVFADHVQPILLKRCSQSGCHGLSSTNRLKFVQPIGNARARISEQNCRSALQFVEVDESNMSILLRYAVVPHGLQKTAAITAQEPKLVEMLQSWSTFARNPVVAAVDQQPGGTKAAGATPAVYTEAANRAVGANPVATAGGVQSATKQPTAVGPAPLQPLAPGASQLRAVPSGGTPTQREIDELDDLVRRALGEPPRQSDPFDPAEFNRSRTKQP